LGGWKIFAAFLHRRFKPKRYVKPVFQPGRSDFSFGIKRMRFCFIFEKEDDISLLCFLWKMVQLHLPSQ
jgi:hypothetical protein